MISIIIIGSFVYIYTYIYPSNLLFCMIVFALVLVFYFERLLCLTVNWLFIFIQSSPALSFSDYKHYNFFSNLLPTTLPKIFLTLLLVRYLQNFPQKIIFAFVMFLFLTLTKKIHIENYATFIATIT